MSISNQNQLSDLAVILMQQQGLLFTNTDEAEHCKLGLVQELGDITAHAQIFFVEGLQLLNQLNQPIIKATVQQLLAHPDSYEELQKIQQSAVLNEPKTQKLFYEAVNSFYDCGDTHREQCVTSVLLVLFPFNPQSYIYFATLIWRQCGIAAAAAFYHQFAEGLKNPLLDYFAADCLQKNGEKSKAKILCQRALATIDTTNDYHELLPQLQNLLTHCG